MFNVYNNVPINPHDFVEFHSWDSSNQSCVDSNCSPCSVPIKLDRDKRDTSRFSVFNGQKLRRNSDKYQCIERLPNWLMNSTSRFLRWKSTFCQKMSKINYYNSLKNNLKFGQLLIKDYLKLLTLVETMSTTSRKKLKAQYLAMNVFLFLQLAVTFHTTNGKLIYKWKYYRDVRVKWPLQNSCPYVYNEDDQ